MTDIAARLQRHPPPARLRRLRLVHGQPGGVQLLAPVRGDGLHQGHRAAHPLLHRVVAGHQQQAARQPVPLRHADGGADPRPDAHRPAGHDGRESRCLAWQFPHRAADQGPHARHRQARRHGWSSSTRARPRPPRSSSGWASSPTATPTSCCRCCRSCSPTASSTARSVERRPTGWTGSSCSAAPFTPEATAVAHRHRAAMRFARWRATCRRPRARPSTGDSVRAWAQNGTLTAYLIDAVNLVAGKLDRARWQRVQHARHAGSEMADAGDGCRRSPGAIERKRSRIGGFRSVTAAEPAALMAKEITTPGDRQIKALFTSAGNPVLSVPNGEELEAAIARPGANGRTGPLRERDDCTL